MRRTIPGLAADLAKAQLEMHNPAKDAVNPHFKSRYADLASVRNAVLPVLGKYKLSVVQLPTECESGPALLTILMHSTGEYIQTLMLIRATKSDPQGVGSALTYARRYALQSVAGVAADDDDDGNAGSRQAAPEEAPKAMVPSDAKAVASLEAALRGSQTRAEYDAAVFLVQTASAKNEITPKGVLHLRDVCKEVMVRFPGKPKKKAEPVAETVPPSTEEQAEQTF